jgi:hypothetical protein
MARKRRWLPLAVAALLVPTGVPGRRGVPFEAIKTKVIVDPVWGPPSDGGPAVDVLVS